MQNLTLTVCSSQRGCPYAQYHKLGASAVDALHEIAARLADAAAQNRHSTGRLPERSQPPRVQIPHRHHQQGGGLPPKRPGGQLKLQRLQRGKIAQRDSQVDEPSTEQASQTRQASALHTATESKEREPELPKTQPKQGESISQGLPQAASLARLPPPLPISGAGLGAAHAPNPAPIQAPTNGALATSALPHPSSGLPPAPTTAASSAPAEAAAPSAPHPEGASSGGGGVPSKAAVSVAATATEPRIHPVVAPSRLPDRAPPPAPHPQPRSQPNSESQGSGSKAPIGYPHPQNSASSGPVTHPQAPLPVVTPPVERASGRVWDQQLVLGPPSLAAVTLPAVASNAMAVPSFKPEAPAPAPAPLIRPSPLSCAQLRPPLPKVALSSGPVASAGGSGPEQQSGGEPPVRGPSPKLEISLSASSQGQASRPASQPSPPPPGSKPLPPPRAPALYAPQRVITSATPVFRPQVSAPALQTALSKAAANRRQSLPRGPGPSCSSPANPEVPAAPQVPVGGPTPGDMRGIITEVARAVPGAATLRRPGPGYVPNPAAGVRAPVVGSLPTSAVPRGVEQQGQRQKAVDRRVAGTLPLPHGHACVPPPVPRSASGHLPPVTTGQRLTSKMSVAGPVSGAAQGVPVNKSNASPTAGRPVLKTEDTGGAYEAVPNAALARAARVQAELTSFAPRVANMAVPIHAQAPTLQTTLAGTGAVPGGTLPTREPTTRVPFTKSQQLLPQQPQPQLKQPQPQLKQPQPQLKQPQLRQPQPQLQQQQRVLRSGLGKPADSGTPRSPPSR